jgi:uncharacterized protein
MMDFRELNLDDKETFNEFFSQDPPRTSELTFTNLFMWRLRFKPVWAIWNGCLLIIMQGEDGKPFGLPPVGRGPKNEAVRVLLDRIAESSSDTPLLCRVGKDFIASHVDTELYTIIEDRDNSDYIYLTENLARLAGNRFHRKKNHLNRFIKNYQFEYRNLGEVPPDAFLELQEDWCELKGCVDNPGLSQENRAIYEALTNSDRLDFTGGAILINSKVEAFALGEMLNTETVVIHVEKANPEIPGLYVAINQQFCENAWSGVKYVNREQDLGVEGLRKAKLSYYPDHFVEKFSLASR